MIFLSYLLMIRDIFLFSYVKRESFFLYFISYFLCRNPLTAGLIGFIKRNVSHELVLSVNGVAFRDLFTWINKCNAVEYGWVPAYNCRIG